MKKILITAGTLDIGGIETSLINMLRTFDYSLYDVTLVLEHATGIFMDMVPKKVKVIDYNLCDSKNVLVRKVKNRSKLLFWYLKHRNKYDFAISFATFSFVGARIALNASPNNAIWIHGDYYTGFDNNKKKLEDFFSKIKVNKFNSIMKTTNEVYNIKGNQHVINNIIDGDSIIKKSKEKIEYKKSNLTTFINVGRHEEKQKRLTRLLNACKQLKEDNYKFRLLMIGDGPDCEMYKQFVEDNGLKDSVQFLGKKQNPFPYYKIADAVVLSSIMEGYPVVFNEARVLNIPLITTKVSDYEDIDEKYGIVTEQDDIYNGLKKFLDDGFEIKKRFDYIKYNNEIINAIYSIIQK